MIYDVVVVGSGAVGGSIAFELASRGMRVCRVGETRRGNAASRAAGAMNGCFGEVTRGLLASEPGRLKLVMDIQAKGLWARWQERLAQASGNPDGLLSACGTHVILNSAGSAQVDSVNYAAIEQTLRDYQTPYTPVVADQLEWMNACDLVRPMQALLIPDENAIDPNLLLEKLDAALLGTGGEIVEANARSVLTEGHCVTGVALHGGRHIAATHVVIAAGIDSLSLLDGQAEVQRCIPPLFAGYGVSLLLRLKPGQRGPQTVIRTPNRAFACGLHCVPRGPDLLYVGATNILTEQPRTQALVSDVQFLLDCAVDQLNLDLHDASIVDIQVGNRPIPADGFPLLGECGYDGLWLATGTYRDGLHQSPLLAAWIADRIEGLENRLDLSCFAPVREPLPGLARAETVAETVRQMFATGYEYRWNIKPYWMPLLDQGMSDNYTRLIDALHPRFTPPPELVAFSWLHRSMYERLARYYEAWS